MARRCIVQALAMVVMFVCVFPLVIPAEEIAAVVFPFLQ